MNPEEIQQDLNNRYLVFKINETCFAAQLLDVREVVQYQLPKTIPNTRKHFSGVINLRGAIVGVVNLRTKCGFSPLDNLQKSVFLVCDTDSGFLAALVDGVESVLTIEENQIEKNPPVQIDIEQKYLTGVAKIEDKLISIINLKQFLSEEKLTVEV